MSLTKTVVAAVIERGAASVDDIAHLFPECGRKQLRLALSNARAAGWLQVTVQGQSRGGLGSGVHGSLPNIYAPGEVAVPPPKERAKAEPEAQEDDSEDDDAPLSHEGCPHRGVLPKVSSVWELGTLAGAST